jgi:ABC-type uncharacterized transport system permease subunit
MSGGQLPRWVDYGLIPFLNLAAAFLVSGLVVILIGENPIDAVKVLIWGSLGLHGRLRIHTLLCNQLHFHRARGGSRVSRRPL